MQCHTTTRRALSINTIIAVGLLSLFQNSSAQSDVDFVATDYPTEFSTDDPYVFVSETVFLSPLTTSPSDAADPTVNDDPIVDDTNDTSEELLECNEMEKKVYASVCCPMVDSKFQSFCKSVLGRPLKVSTGAIVTHKPGTGGVEDSGNNDEKQKDDEDTKSDSDNQKDEDPNESEEQKCDEMEKAFAPDCCPMVDPTFQTFCESLLNRPHKVSSGMIEAHVPWIGNFFADNDPN